VHAIARRIGFYILTAIAAVTVDFFIPRVMPGNPVDAVLAKMQGTVVTQATRRALELQFGAAGTPVERRMARGRVRAGFHSHARHHPAEPGHRDSRPVYRGQPREQAPARP